TDASADGAGAVVADQVVDHVLDAMIPGAGMLHTMLSAMDTGGGSAVAPAVIRRPQQQQDECDTTGSDVTHENEPENE
ncbi:hypothetical protein, partial [Acidithiobacillus ferriphilus]